MGFQCFTEHTLENVALDVLTTLWCSTEYFVRRLKKEETETSDIPSVSNSQIWAGMRGGAKREVQN